jgi:hypothetical protein
MISAVTARLGRWSAEIPRLECEETGARPGAAAAPTGRARSLGEDHEGAPLGEEGAGALKGAAVAPAARQGNRLEAPNEPAEETPREERGPRQEAQIARRPSTRSRKQSRARGGEDQTGDAVGKCRRGGR